MDRIFDKYHFDRWAQDGMADEIEFDGRAYSALELLTGRMSENVAAEPVTEVAAQSIENYLIDHDELLAQQWLDSNRTIGVAVPLLAKVRDIEIEALAS